VAVLQYSWGLAHLFSSTQSKRSRSKDILGCPFLALQSTISPSKSPNPSIRKFMTRTKGLQYVQYSSEMIPLKSKMIHTVCNHSWFFAETLIQQTKYNLRYFLQVGCNFAPPQPRLYNSKENNPESKVMYTLRSIPYHTSFQRLCVAKHLESSILDRFFFGLLAQYQFSKKPTEQMTFD
jgi:hypothetical protein